MALTKKNITFIDGYNVINKWAELKELSKESLADSRDALIEEMAEYKSLSGEDVVIVFDAYNLDRIKETIIERYGMKVVYTKRFQTADTYIERQLVKIDRNHDIKVVTDDGAVQTQASGKGASRVTAMELKTDLNTMRAKIKRKRKEDFNQNFKTFPIADKVSDIIDKIKEDLENW
ncbi:NYN domain-containing protein [uncultured Anaerococcus sp.]|uniref:YacP-like NYN domain-containing protein n=1 Tax=uncultured Anaerococcus sp. TaxID=293428 RepID=UPI0026379108|nr:NYN domain-containing protein [uncultured Anaerococcus sp.]